MQAVGKVHTLWTAFARFYERHGDLDNARVIFDKATQVPPACHHIATGKYSASNDILLGASLPWPGLIVLLVTGNLQTYWS